MNDGHELAGAASTSIASVGRRVGHPAAAGGSSAPAPAAVAFAADGTRVRLGDRRQLDARCDVGVSGPAGVLPLRGRLLRRLRSARRRRSGIVGRLRAPTSRRRCGAGTAPPGDPSTTGEALETLHAGEHAGGLRIGLGDGGSDQGELEREARRRGPAHVVLRVEQQRDHPGELGGLELLRLVPEPFVSSLGDVDQVLLPRRGPHEQQVAEMPSVSDVRWRSPAPPSTSRWMISKTVRASPTATASASSRWISARGVPNSVATIASSTSAATRDHHRLVEEGEGVAERSLRLARDRRARRRASARCSSSFAMCCR